MLRRARKRYEKENIREKWIGKEVFEEMLKFWETDPGFKQRSEHGKKMRASEKGGGLNAVGSITVAEHSRRLVINYYYFFKLIFYLLHIFN